MNSRRDITERKQAEEARAQLAAIVETTGDAVVSCAPDGTVLSWNAGAERILGYPAAEIIGRNITIIAPADRRHEMQHHEWLLQHGKSVPPFETIRVAKDGRLVDVQMTVSAIPDAAGGVARIAYIFRDVTERKRNEAERTQLAAIVEDSNDAIISRRLDGTVTSWNAGAERMFGYSASEAIGRPIEALILPPERRARVAQNIERVRRGEAIAPYETQRITKDGRVIDILSSVSPIRNAAGDVTGASIILHDISELKRAEAELVRLAAIVESTNDAIISRALDGTIMSWNAAAERMFGYTAVEAIGRDLNLLPPERQHEHAENLKLARQDTQVPDHDTVRVTRDGRRIDVSLSVSPIKDGSGNIIGTASIFRDITQRLEAEENLHLAAQVIENSQEGVIITDASNHIISVNPAFTAITGYAPQEVIGKTPAILSSGMQGKEFYQAMWASIKAIGHWEGEIWDRRKNGELYCEALSVSTVKNPRGEIVYHTAIFSDISERKKAELERGQLAAIVQSSQDAIIGRTLDGTITSWNAAAERLYGYTTEEVVGQRALLLTPPELHDETGQNRQLLTQGIPVPPYETVRLTKDGRRIHVQMSLSPIRDGGGNVIGASSNSRDISERKRAEAERARLATIVENSGDAIISRSLDRTILTWNAAAERLLGWSAQEAVGQSIHLIVPPERRGENARYREMVHKGLPVPAYDTARLAKDGRRIDVSLSQSPIKNERGEVVAVSVFLRDITERVLSTRRRAMEHAVTRVLAESGTLREAMPKLIRTVCEVMDWAYGARWAWDEVEQRLCRAEHWSAFAAEFEPSDREYWLQLASGGPGGLLRRAWLNKEATWLPDTQADAGFRRKPSCAKFGLRSAYSFPVLAGNAVIGVMEFFGREVRHPDEMLLQITDSIGRQIGQFIQRKEAEEALGMSEERFRATFEQAGVGMGLRALDPRNPRWLRVNQKLCEIFGYTEEELLQLNTVDLTPPEDRATAIDYNEQLLRGEITSYSREKRYVRKDGSMIWTNVSLAAARGPDGRPAHVISVIQDITERKQAEERIGFLAQYDMVTGLPNRQLFSDRLTLAMARDKRLGSMTALLHLDLDRFKQINETLGHSAGDEALQMVTARLRDRLREVDTIARLGGDEFAVILESVAEKGQALRVAEKIMEAMADPLVLKGEEVFVTASIGIAVYPADADSMEKLIESAELAMYQAKQEGRNTAQLYTPDPNPRRSAGLGMENRLRRALERDELLLHFQPKVDVRTGAITGAEALVRWRNPDLGMVSPADFIPIAEETGLIVPIGEWVLHSACAQAGAWHREGHPISMAVNLSARQFRQSNLCETVELALADSALEAGHLELEITESMIMHRPEQTIATLQRLHDIGLILSVDDFGTGYSSLSYLKRFPVHKLKIDQSFVRELHKNADDSAIVRAVIALATSLNLKTVAEGVETEQQLIYLAGLHCDEYQGYYFSKPLPVADFLQLLKAHPDPARSPRTATRASAASRRQGRIAAKF
jgi:diguanylate cyclase (GGDEF)-like protein/PAS domain S-box-containing protein